MPKHTATFLFLLCMFKELAPIFLSDQSVTYLCTKKSVTFLLTVKAALESFISALMIRDYTKLHVVVTFPMHSVTLK